MRSQIRIGKVSSVNADAGMVSVLYPDCDSNTTVELPVFSFTGEYRMPSEGDSVLVLHLSNGQSAGVVMGGYWNAARKSGRTGRGVFRKELGKGAYLDYDETTGVLTIHAPKVKFEAGSVDGI